jgi:hypothetical protein
MTHANWLIYPQRPNGMLSSKAYEVKHALTKPNLDTIRILPHSMNSSHSWILRQRFHLKNINVRTVILNLFSLIAKTNSQVRCECIWLVEHCAWMKVLATSLHANSFLRWKDPYITCFSTSIDLHDKNFTTGACRLFHIDFLRMHACTYIWGKLPFHAHPRMISRKFRLW